MLVRFNVGNFLSFNSVQEFSMIGGKVKSKNDHIENNSEVKLLKFGAVFGANASGKSNLIKAIDFARSVIITGVDNSFSNSYFRLDEINIDIPSYFEFEIKIGSSFYAYGFEILLNKNEFTSEWLHEISPNSKLIIFERDLVKGTYRSDVKLSKSSIKNRMDVYSEDLKKQTNILFLNEMNRNKDELYKEKTALTAIKNVYRWFFFNLDVNYPDSPISNYSFFYNEMDTDKICMIIKAFGTGITNFNVINSTFDDATEVFPKQLIKKIENDINKMILNKKANKLEGMAGITIRANGNIFIIGIKDNLEPDVKTFVFEHNKKGTTFKFSEESDGTRRILDLIEILITDQNERVYVIDEIDRSLHPQLTYKFIETFLSLSKNRTNQLIVTTHESRLLDFELLRRDEIWFVDKNEKGESSIYSLEAYNERFDKKIDKAYLEGRYGGVPIFSEIFPVKGDC